MSTQEPYDDYAVSKGLWSRVKDRVFGADDSDEVDDESMPEPRRRAAIRLESSRGVRVAVRLQAVVFNDAKAAADGLKAGQQQIVNLEKADPGLAERIIDFLNGVTYALDGSVERIGDRVYMFAPANFHVEVDGGADPL